MIWFVGWLTDWLTDWLIDWLIDCWIHCWIDWQVTVIWFDLLIVLLFDLTGLFVDWLIDWLVAAVALMFCLAVVFTHRCTICAHTHTYIYIYIYTSLSLSLSVCVCTFYMILCLYPLRRCLAALPLGIGTPGLRSERRLSKVTDIFSPLTAQGSYLPAKWEFL